MNSEINTGGPAFPCETVGQDELGEYRLPWQGISLRDYFAAKAMQANWQTMLSQSAPKNADAAIELMASVSYKVADAMIAAREKGGAA